MSTLTILHKKRERLQDFRSNAMHNYVSRYPYVAMSVYRQGDDLYNFCMDCALCAYDQTMDDYKEK